MSMLFAGIYKFREAGSGTPAECPTRSDLEKLAREWLDTHSVTYEFLHVRGCGKNDIGIEFRGTITNDLTSRQFVSQLTHTLRLRFGNALIGWDVGSVDAVIR